MGDAMPRISLLPLSRPGRRSLSVPALVVLGLALLFSLVRAGVALAEEALVLDNGAILRGTVVREDAKSLTFKLAGLGTDSKITVERSHILQRFTTVDPQVGVAASKPAPAEATNLASEGVPVPSIHSADGVPAVLAPSSPEARTPSIPEEEPEARHETFFERAARRAGLAFPREAPARAFLMALAIAVLLCLVALGGRMADIQGLTLGRSTGLALLLGGLVMLNVVWADTFMRADRAPVLVPLEFLAWVGCAAGILRCGFGKAIQLLAFVVFSLALVTFSAGVVLVSI